MTVTIRSTGDPASLTAAIREGVASVDKDIAVANIKTMQRIMDDSVAGRRLNMMLLSIFATVALILASVGIYGVLSYSIAQRTHEIGVRMALGAKATDVLRLVVGDGLKLVLAGVGIGLAGAFALTQVMKSLLFEVSATDPLTFAVIPLILTAVALLSSYVPARRAMKVDPMIALRYQVVGRAYGKSVVRCSLRNPCAFEKSRIHCRRIARVDVRHRREYSNLQRCEHRIASPARL